MARTLFCPAGEWTVLFNHAFVQLPRTWTVIFTAPGGAPISGEVVEKRSAWIFSQPPTHVLLSEQMVFTRGWWNTFYSVRIKPDVDVSAQIR